MSELHASAGPPQDTQSASGIPEGSWYPESPRADVLAAAEQNPDIVHGSTYSVTAEQSDNPWATQHFPAAAPLRVEYTQPPLSSIPAQQEAAQEQVEAVQTDACIAQHESQVATLTAVTERAPYSVRGSLAAGDAPVEPTEESHIPSALNANPSASEHLAAEPAMAKAPSKPVVPALDLHMAYEQQSLGAELAPKQQLEGAILQVESKPPREAEEAMAPVGLDAGEAVQCQLLTGEPQQEGEARAGDFLSGESGAAESGNSCLPTEESGRLDAGQGMTSVTSPAGETCTGRNTGVSSGREAFEAARSRFQTAELTAIAAIPTPPAEKSIPPEDWALGQGLQEQEALIEAESLTTDAGTRSSSPAPQDQLASPAAAPVSDEASKGEKLTPRRCQIVPVGQHPIQGYDMLPQTWRRAGFLFLLLHYCI